MTWGIYGAYLVFVVLLVLAPGPDTTVILKNSLVGGRRAGMASLLGIFFGNAVQGTAAALGVGELITRSQPLFLTIRYVGAAYLVYLGIQAFRAARRGKGPDLGSDPAEPTATGPRRGRMARSWLQGALSNLTNPKILALYLSVLPQFLARGHADIGTALLLAWTVAVLGALWQLVVVALVHRMRDWIRSRKVRTALDAATGTALVGFGIALAADR
jgi:threonine/homoserine/homoserine lactone efflux protein